MERSPGKPRFSLGRIAFCGLFAALACAEQADSDDLEFSQTGGTNGTAGSGSGGSLPVAGSANYPGKGGVGGGAGKGGSASAGSSPGAGSGGSNNTSGSDNSGGSNSGGAPVYGCLTGEGGAGGMSGEGGGSGEGGAMAGAPGAGGADLAATKLLFFEDFESGNADRWSPEEGDWAIATDGSLVYRQSLEDNDLQFSMATGTCWADQRVEARVKVENFDGQSNQYVAALFARALGAETHYVLVLGGDGKLALRKRVDSTSNSAQILGSAFQPKPEISEGVWYTLRLEVVGATLKAYLDGSLRITATDSSIASGGVAVGTINASAMFDDVSVSAP